MQAKGRAGRVACGSLQGSVLLGVVWLCECGVLEPKASIRRALCLPSWCLHSAPCWLGAVHEEYGLSTKVVTDFRRQQLELRSVTLTAPGDGRGMFSQLSYEDRGIQRSARGPCSRLLLTSGVPRGCGARQKASAHLPNGHGQKHVPTTSVHACQRPDQQGCRTSWGTALEGEHTALVDCFIPIFRVE